VNKWKRNAILAVMALIVFLCAPLMGIVAIYLLAAVGLISLGFMLGWSMRGDAEMASFIYNLADPPDEEGSRV
jgi:hypothetical protein